MIEVGQFDEIINRFKGPVFGFLFRLLQSEQLAEQLTEQALVYRYAIDEFIQWYCSEPRVSFSKVVVTRYRIFLENRNLAAGTINGQLAAVRRLAYEAANSGLLSSEFAA